MSPADLDLRSGQLLRPDLFFTGLVSGRVPMSWSEAGLVVEVVIRPEILIERSNGLPREGRP